MKLFSALLLVVSTSGLLFAQPPKAKSAAPAVPAKPAAPAQPAKPKTAAVKPKAIIGSDLDGRELAFVSSALDLGKAHLYLTTIAARTTDPSLREAGKDHVNEFRKQGVMLDAIAEMRKMEATASPTRQRWSEKLDKLQGPRLEKTLLDAWMEVDSQLIATYETGQKSSDEAIRNLVEQSLPPLRQHLELLQGMAGIGPRRTAKAAANLPPVAEALPKAPEPATPPPAPKKPAFRTNLPLPEGRL